MATFYGISMFGVVQETDPVANPNERQFSSYSGVNGVSSINLGSRGGRTTIRGYLGGATYLDVMAQWSAVIAYQTSGLSATFVNDYGGVYPSSVIETFVPRSRILAAPTGWFRLYECVIFHHI
jgi:hypothetical protein